MPENADHAGTAARLTYCPAFCAMVRPCGDEPLKRTTSPMAGPMGSVNATGDDVLLSM
ncbi:MAG: hypothetical protein ACHREM_14935 [Polyangiales bacterium]